MIRVVSRWGKVLYLFQTDCDVTVGYRKYIWCESGYANGVCQLGIRGGESVVPGWLGLGLELTFQGSARGWCGICQPSPKTGCVWMAMSSAHVLSYWVGRVLVVYFWKLVIAY